VAVAYALDLAGDSVKSIKIGLGGVAATPLRATAVEEFLAGKAWNRDTVREAAIMLGQQGTPLDDHRASANYRAAMLRTSLLKFFAANPVARTEVSA
jgi:xanthine dehydrogenase small subunit